MLNLTQLSPPILPLTGNYFVTGTDTEIGKTTTTRQLIKILAEQGKSCYAIKPITAGLDGAGESEDAQRINEFANLKPPPSAVAPILLATPCSPHIASKLAGIRLTAAAICGSVHQTIARYPAECILIEGAGGWFTPINEATPLSETLADVALGLDLPIIVVVGIKLGCINHAVLTLQAIWQAGGQVAMVVFNSLSKNTNFEQEQIQWLQTYILQSITTKNLSHMPYPLFAMQSFLG